MKGFYLLITLLLAVLSKAAGQAAVPESSDLVVTAEIMGYAPDALPYLKEEHPRIVLYAKMTVRNTTNHVRDISMMNCDWPSSWIAKGSDGLFNPTVQPSCNKNAPTVVSIPVGEAVVFECPLLLMNGHIAKVKEQNSVYCFKLGFIEFASGFENFSYTRMLEFKDDGHSVSKLKKRRARKKETPPRIYWSNLISSEINMLTVKEITDDSRYFAYHLTHNGN